MTIDGIVKVAGDEIVAKMIMIAYGSVAKPLLGLEFGDRVLDTQGAWLLYFFSSGRRHTSWPRDWSSVVCSSDLGRPSRSVEARLRREHRGAHPVEHPARDGDRARRYVGAGHARPEPSPGRRGAPHHPGARDSQDRKSVV